MIKLFSTKNSPYDKFFSGEKVLNRAEDPNPTFGVRFRLNYRMELSSLVIPNTWTYALQDGENMFCEYSQWYPVFSTSHSPRRKRDNKVAMSGKSGFQILVHASPSRARCIRFLYFELSRVLVSTQFNEFNHVFKRMYFCSLEFNEFNHVLKLM